MITEESCGTTYNTYILFHKESEKFMSSDDLPASSEDNVEESDSQIGFQGDSCSSSRYYMVYDSMCIAISDWKSN